MARSNLQIATGTYTGNSSDSRNITAVGWQPDLLIIKDITAASGVNSVFRTKVYRGDSGGFLTSANGNLTDRIQNLQATGFQVGTSAQVNANNDTYQWIAMRGANAQDFFRVGNYSGNGSDSRNFTDATINFTPDLAVIQQYTTGQTTRLQLSTISGDNTLCFDGVATAANLIQNLQANGFQLGTHAAVNTNTTEYVYWLMKALAGVFQVGTFTGSGVAKQITGVGFQPDIVIVKNQTTGTVQARILTSDMVTLGTQSFFMGSTASDANGITSLDSDGFTVGTGNGVNKAGDTIHWMAWKTGSFNVPLTRLTS